MTHKNTPPSLPGKDYSPSDSSLETAHGGIEPVFCKDLSLVNDCNDLLMGDGNPAPHWQGLISYLNGLGSRELDRRWQKARQIMHEHGAAYNLFSDQKEMERPWELDPIPFPIPAETWNFLEKGIHQRTRLLTAIYADIYGSQTLIQNHHLPPELFFANPRFLRQCHGLYPGTRLKLHFHGTDLCRFSDGQWRVLSDRTQTPSGAGFALENRIILSRILPRMFHSGKVMRLAPFFKDFNHSLMAISGMEKREPFIVTLSPGPSTPNYFEHVFLSRYLGLTLVESSDLTIRNDQVFLKTLGGLHPVDVILRRIEDAFCDPLVFGNTSLTGVPGLVQAVRAGNVAVSNPLGSGVLETPGLAPFLPGLCRLLLNEELILQDIPTSWCGQPEPMNRVLSRISDNRFPMIIASAFARPHIQTMDTRDLTPEKIQTLSAKIKAAPYAYICREPMTSCTLPVWDKGSLKNSWAAMRMFSFAMTGTGTQTRDPEKILIMPGALTRMSDDPTGFQTHGGEDRGSKDTWCFSNEIVEHQSMMHHFSEALEIHRGSDLPSRVADNMLWLGRYVERTEGMLRAVRSLLSRLNSETRLDLIEEFPFLLRTMAKLEIISPELSEPNVVYSMRILETEILESLLGTARSGSIRSFLAHVKQVAASVRDRLSNDSWHILGRLENELVRFTGLGHHQPSEIQELLNEMILTMSAFAGLAQESMTRGMGWRFMDMGRRIERAKFMITLLLSLFSSKGNPKTQELEVLLEVADSTITYHTRYRTTLHVEPIVDLLLLDELNPRAVGFQIASLLDHVETLPRNTPRPFRTKEEKLALDLTTQLRLTDIQELMEMTREGTRPKLLHQLERLNTGIKELANTITQHYLSRIETEKQLRNVLENPGKKAGFSHGKELYEV